jgi:peptide chain release factor 3
VDCATQTAHLFAERDGDRRIKSHSLHIDQVSDPQIRPEVVSQTREDMELVQGAGASFDVAQFLAGKQTPVFFGSALTNFGVEHFLRGFLALCPVPGARQSDLGPVPAARPEFSGFVFKIQANLDPRHRDRVAFLRVCSGKFQREMEVFHPRSGKKLRLNRAHRVFGQDRETMDEAFPGDIIGLVNPGEFHLGDTICEGSPLEFEPLPQFSPEHFAVLQCRDTLRRKQFGRGMEQLIEEGAIQTFMDPRAAQRELILGAMGKLQFDVVRFRLEHEYNTLTDMTPMPYQLARWVTATPEQSKDAHLPFGAKVVKDQYGCTAILFKSQWDANYFTRENPQVSLSPVRVSKTQAAVDLRAALAG